MSFDTVAGVVYAVHENICITNDYVGVHVGNTELALYFGLVFQMELKNETVVESGHTKTVESPFFVAKELACRHPPGNLKLLPASIQHI